jgi:hypothetical protein
MLPWLSRRLATLGSLVRFFGRGDRIALLPLLLILLATGVLLIATSGLSYVAPFVYTLF